MSVNKNISGEHAPSFIDPKEKLFGHPKGLMVLFFTEMWERFSYYGMRAILVLFLVSTVNGGLGWTETEALGLYGWYTMLVYLASIPGGILADKLIGQKRSVMLGGFTLVAGHFLMALPETWAFYVALGLIIAGTGMLKPNISTMVGGLYREGDPKRDSGFTIFYMGINLGAFLASIIVGYVGETIGWHYGFSLAGVGMLLGQLVFIGGQKYLKGVGNYEKSMDRNFNKNERTSTGKGGFTKVEKDRLVLLGISFVIVLVFWAAFEQAGGLMNLYTKNYTDRYVGEEINVNEYKTAGKTATDSVAIYSAKKAVENKRVTEFSSVGEFFTNLISPRTLSQGEIVANLENEKVEFNGSEVVPAQHISTRTFITTKGEVDSATYNAVMDESAPVLETEDAYLIADLKPEQTGFIVPASWFQSLNSLFIIIFGPVFAAIWIALAKRGTNPPSIFKMGLGTAVMGAGFIFMVFATMERNNDLFGMSSMHWLVLAYMFHTLGELALSPVALSYITKLAPKRVVASMMGLYFAVTGVGNKVAAELGELAQDLGAFEIFGGIAVVTIVLGTILMLFSRNLNKLSHGAEDEHEEEKDAQAGQLLEAEAS